MISKVATSAAICDEFRHMQDKNTILFDKNKLGNENFELDCQRSQSSDPPWCLTNFQTCET